MSRAAAIGFAAIVGAALFLGYQARNRGPVVVDADETTALLEGMATNQAAELTAIAPTETVYVTSTPTRTPKPPTSTPHPTYGPDASPGLWIVPAWTETSIVPMTVEAVGLPQCADVTPRPYADQPCRVDE